MINNINVLIELLNSLIDKITFPVIKVLEKLITFLLSFSKYLPKFFDVLPRFSGGLMIIVGLLICFLIMKMFNKYENRYVRFAGKYKGKSNKYQIFNSSDLPEYITSLRYEKDGWISVESGSRCVYKGGGVYSIQAGTGISSEGGEKYKPVFLADHPIYIYVREGDSKEILNTNEYKAKEFIRKIFWLIPLICLSLFGVLNSEIPETLKINLRMIRFLVFGFFLLFLCGHWVINLLKCIGYLKIKVFKAVGVIILLMFSCLLLYKISLLCAVIVVAIEFFYMVSESKFNCTLHFERIVREFIGMTEEEKRIHINENIELDRKIDEERRRRAAIAMAAEAQKRRAYEEESRRRERNGWRWQEFQREQEKKRQDLDASVPNHGTIF